MDSMQLLSATILSNSREVPSFAGSRAHQPAHRTPTAGSRHQHCSRHGTKALPATSTGLEPGKHVVDMLVSWVWSGEG